MTEKENSLAKALLDLLKVVLYIILLLFGFITCFLGVLIFAWTSGLHNGKTDVVVSVVITLLIEGIGVLMLYLAGRVIGKGRSALNAMSHTSERTNN